MFFEAQAYGHADGIIVRMTCYTGDYDGELHPASEIEEMAWLKYADMDKVSPVGKTIFNYLKARGMIE